MIKAITIDFWETIIKDVYTTEKDRDFKRAHYIIEKLGLKSNATEKIITFFKDLNEAFKHPSKENYWSILPENQLKKLFEEYLHISVNEKEFKDILNYYENVILEIPPKLTEEIVKEVLQKLSNVYSLVLISNTGRTPGRVLLKIMEMYEVKDCFKYFVFSDEIGARKPDPFVFEIAQKLLNLPKNEIVHIGDSVNLDFLGAKNYGFNAILYANGMDNIPVEPFIRSFSELDKVLNEKFS